MAVKFYIDGQLSGNVTLLDLPTVNNGIFVIGGYNTTQPFKGIIDDVRVYNRALNGLEIQQLSK